ncbi:MAG: polynucleotide adenylyltransferase [Clostridiaceae bacterium]|nr:polynucleotide adenylyltransferase [Clostridiaceae bacterium]
MQIILPEKIRSIISVLNHGGYSAHAVGGCVRDMLMGNQPQDWDITTSARPEQVKRLFKITFDTGLKHGTVTVNFAGQLCEITTWRTDLCYSNHRHPEQVRFTDSLEADLARRDFTINAMAFHPDEGITDPFGGMEDIGKKRIRSVGDPAGRFNEDALRMLRAIRFSAQLGFDIEEPTYDAIKDLHGDIAYISFERIRTELDKILSSVHPEKLALIWDTRLSDHIFPGIPAFPESCVKACHSPYTGKGQVFILSSLFFGAFNKDRDKHAETLLRRLKYDNRTISGVKKVLWAAETLKTPSLRNIRLASHLYGAIASEMAANILALGGSWHNKGIFATNLSQIAEQQRLLISGADLIGRGIGEGREIGAILSLLHLCIHEKPQLNDPEILLMLSEELHGKLHRHNLL